VPVNEPERKPPDLPEFGLIHTNDSDLPAPTKRRGPGPVRRVVSAVLFLALLAVFTVVIVNRIQHPEVRYLKNREDVFDESVAAAHNATRGNRPRPARRTSVAERNKAVQAYNSIEDAVAEAVRCWNSATGGLPSGEITPGVAADVAATFENREARLAAADRAIADLTREAENIREASRAPGRDAHALSGLYAAARNLEAALRSESGVCRNTVRMERQFFEGASQRDHGECLSANDAVSGCYRRLEEQRAARDHAVEEFRDAADRAFE
jgi:hypothetical protein